MPLILTATHQQSRAFDGPVSLIVNNLFLAATANRRELAIASRLTDVDREWRQGVSEGARTSAGFLAGLRIPRHLTTPQDMSAFGFADSSAQLEIISGLRAK
jgi:hypothetical protein